MLSLSTFCSRCYSIISFLLATAPISPSISPSIYIIFSPPLHIYLLYLSLSLPLSLSLSVSLAMRTRNICDIYFITHSLLPLSDCLPHFLLSALHFSSLYPPPLEGHQTGSVHHRSRGIRLAVYNPHPFRDIRLAVYNPHPFTDIRLAVCNPSPFRGIRLPVYMPPSGTSGCQFIPSNPFRGIRLAVCTSHSPSGSSGWQFKHPTPLQDH